MKIRMKQKCHNKLLSKLNSNVFLLCYKYKIVKSSFSKFKISIFFKGHYGQSFNATRSSILMKKIIRNQKRSCCK
jgi:hypothetical protein